MDKLDARISDEDAKFQIMTECSCRCHEEHLEELRQEYDKFSDIDRLLEAMHGKVFLIKPVRVDITRSVLPGDDVCKFAVHL